MISNQNAIYLFIFPCRSDNSVKNHWNSTIKRKAELGFFRDAAQSISIDIQQFVDGEVQCLLDVVDTF